MHCSACNQSYRIFPLHLVSTGNPTFNKLFRREVLHLPLLTPPIGAPPPPSPRIRADNQTQSNWIAIDDTHPPECHQSLDTCMYNVIKALSR